MPVTNYIDSAKIIAGAASILTSPRTPGSPATVTAQASPSPTTASFAVLTADAAKLKVGDRLQLAATALTFTPTELSTLPVIISIGTQANPVITVSPAFSGAPPSTANGVRVAWENRGATLGGVELSAKKDVTDLYVDQSTAPVASVDGKLDITLKAPLSEADLDNFAISAGLLDPVAGVLSVNSTDASREDRYAFIGPAPNGKTRYAVIHRGKSKGTATHKADKAGQPIYALEVTAYVDSAMTPDLFQKIDV